MIDIGFEPPLEPRAYRVPVCPVCGSETDTILRDMDSVIVGCPECVEAVDAFTMTCLKNTVVLLWLTRMKKRLMYMTHIRAEARYLSISAMKTS